MARDIARPSSGGIRCEGTFVPKGIRRAIGNQEALRDRIDMDAHRIDMDAHKSGRENKQLALLLSNLKLSRLRRHAELGLALFLLAD